MTDDNKTPALSRRRMLKAAGAATVGQEGDGSDLASHQLGLAHGGAHLQGFVKRRGGPAVDREVALREVDPKPHHLALADGQLAGLAQAAHHVAQHLAVLGRLVHALIGQRHQRDQQAANGKGHQQFHQGEAPMCAHEMKTGRTGAGCGQGRLRMSAFSPSPPTVPSAPSERICSSAPAPGALYW